MKNIFSDFLRSMDPDGEPSGDALDGVWTELRHLLHRQLHRRGLADAPPSFLGLTGYTTWSMPGAAAGMPSRTRDALDELVTDCYVELFVRSLPAFRRYLQQGPIEPVIHRSVRNFLTDRQKKSDPLGFRLFQHLVAALRPAVASGRLHVFRGESRIDNSTVLGFGAGGAAEPLPAPSSALEPRIRRFNDEHLLDWFSAQGTALTNFRQKLRMAVLALEDDGIAVFRFRDLVNAVKRDVRVRHAFFWDERKTGGGGGTEGGEPREDPVAAEHVEQRSQLTELSRCVEAKLRRLDVQRRTFEKLLKLWRFLVRFALAAIDDGTDDDRDGGSTGHRDLEAALAADHLPSNRELARLLGIRHDRIPELLARLRVTVEYCQREIRKNPQGGTASGSEVSPDGDSSLESNTILESTGS